MKPKYLLDTNFCVFLLRGMFNAEAQLRTVGLENCCISEITVAELKYGVQLAKLKGIPRREKPLLDLIDSIAVIPISSAIDKYATEKARLRVAGTPIDDDFDLLIGCTAVSLGLVCVTENTKHFKNIDGILLENWIERK